MSTSNVKDSAALEQLRSTFTRNSGCMENALSSFDRYLNETMCSMRDDYEYIDSRFKEAEAELDAAEAALDRCEASQRYDEEAGEYRPSCHGELNRYRAAKDKYDAYKHARDRADVIIKECEKEINEYNQNAKGILTEVISESHNAMNELDVILGKVNDYENGKVTLSGNYAVPYSIEGSNVSNKVKNINPELKKNNIEQFNKASDKLNGLICPKHHRPLPCPICMADAKNDGSLGSGLAIDTANKEPEMPRPKSPIYNEQDQRYAEAQVKLYNHYREKEKFEMEMLLKHLRGGREK